MGACPTLFGFLGDTTILPSSLVWKNYWWVRAATFLEERGPEREGIVPSSPPKYELQSSPDTHLKE